MPSNIPIPASLSELDAQAQRFDTPCGRGTMRWRVWGDGEPLLLLHGGSGSWMHWARNIPVLAQRFRVIAPDTPGLGQSSRPDKPEALSSYADALVRGLLDVVGDAREIDIGAFSFGSIVVGAMLAHPGIAIRKLVLVGPAALGVSKLDGELVAVRHLHGEERRRANAKNLAILMFADAANIDDTAIDIQVWNTRHTRTNSPAFARTTTLRDALIAWDRPLATITGERDATSKPALTTPVLRAIRPDADIRVLSGIGHWCMYEGADEFNATLLNALKTL